MGLRGKKMEKMETLEKKGGGIGRTTVKKWMKVMKWNMSIQVYRQCPG
jgi:hypothetical protein